MNSCISEMPGPAVAVKARAPFHEHDVVLAAKELRKVLEIAGVPADEVRDHELLQDLVQVLGAGRVDERGSCPRR
jgi:hypothetical protein